MTSALYKSMSKLLIIVMILLPLRAVLAIELTDVASDSDVSDIRMVVNNMVDNSSSSDVEQAGMNQHCHGNPSPDVTIYSDSSTEQAHSGCQCCSACDGDCSGCTSMQAIPLELLQFSESNTVEPISIVVPVLLTRSISPPARPPLNFTI